MVFIITELYMSIVMLVSLIILSLRKENYKSLINMMLLFYIITLVIIYDGIINKNISIFILNYNLKIDYITIILKSTIVIFILNIIYNLKFLFNSLGVKNKKFVVKYKNHYKIKKISKRFYGKSNILNYPNIKLIKKEQFNKDYDVLSADVKIYKPMHHYSYYKEKYKDVKIGEYGHFLIYLKNVRLLETNNLESFLGNFKSKSSSKKFKKFNLEETDASITNFKQVSNKMEVHLVNNKEFEHVDNIVWFSNRKNMAKKLNNEIGIQNEYDLKTYINNECYYLKDQEVLDNLHNLD